MSTRSTRLFFILQIIVTQFGTNALILSKPENEKDCLLSIYKWLNQMSNLTKQILLTELTLTPPTVSPGDISFYLYTRSSKIHLKSRVKQLINLSVPTKIIIHGWNSTGREPWVRQMARRYHRSKSCNVVAVDWSRFTAYDYVYAATAVQYVGRLVADFILRIESSSKFLQEVHLIGHSLGGHVAGFAGKRVHFSSGGKIGRISGLDVAAPLFELPILQDLECRLSKFDALFVDVIHTQIGVSVIEAVGHADFYVNAGYLQSQCTSALPNLIDTLTCGHESAYFYFSKTVEEPRVYEAVACDGFQDLLAGVCSKNERVIMGDAINTNVSGIFYILISSIN